MTLSSAFRALSARLGQDPLQVQGPGGNTSVKDGDTMWIKASGTELAQAETADIFVEVALAAARAAIETDGKCTARDPAVTLRPSIETTIHAALPQTVVAHTHSVATLTHVICPEGRAAADEKLAGLPFVRVPYAKPGLPLTREILARRTPDTRIYLLENHGLIGCGDSVEETSDLIAEVEARLALPVHSEEAARPGARPDEAAAWMAHDPRITRIVTAGSYYPDHVVFLGPALPQADHAGHPPAILTPGKGVTLRADATPSQAAMLRCLSDVMARLPEDWKPQAIGEAAEAELLDWDAEKYRQALAARSAQ